MSEVELNEPPVGGYSVTLPSFEGPLDLLLHLCQKHELDILDIPIGFVTEKYLEYLAVMQLMNLDVASEYLVMAATLAHIKSKMLLPAPPPGQEDELDAEEQDPREALIRRLLEYQKYKYAGEELASRGIAGRDVFLRGVSIDEAVQTGLPPLAQVPLFSLVEAFQNVLEKSKIKLSHDVVHERITLTDRINELVDILRVRRRVAFEELFADAATRFDIVITFLALLEMTRLRMTRLFQADFDSNIYIEFTAQVTADDDVLEGAGAAPAAEAPAADPAIADEARDVDAEIAGDLGELEELADEVARRGDRDQAVDPPPLDLEDVARDLADAGMDELLTQDLTSPEDLADAPPPLELEPLAADEPSRDESSPPSAVLATPRAVAAALEIATGDSGDEAKTASSTPTIQSPRLEDGGDPSTTPDSPNDEAEAPVKSPT